MKWAGPVTDQIDGTAMEVDYVRGYQRGEKQAAAAEPAPAGPDFTAMIQPVPESGKFIDRDCLWTHGNLYCPRSPRRNP
jgi:hypothetical protein